MASASQDTTAAPPGLRDWPGFQLFKCGWWLQQRVEEALIPLGLRGRHFMVLTMLQAGEDLSQQEMATYMSLDPTSMVALIDDLEGDRLCERVRDARDRRRYVVRITLKGRRLYERARRMVADIEADILSPLSAAERDALARMMADTMEPYWAEKLVPPRARRPQRRAG